MIEEEKNYGEKAVEYIDELSKKLKKEQEDEKAIL